MHKITLQCLSGVGCLLSFGLCQAAEHRPLLPWPQKAQYGDARLPLGGLSIRFASKPGEEDRFAAKELSSVLSEITGSEIPVREGRAKGKSIVLSRTGAVAAVPGKDERPGPESREAYSISVTSNGAEIRARSSAGLYYGVQTMRQLVEGAGADAALPEIEVEDWPALAYRGFMMDFSHGPLLKEGEIERQIDFLARWKANQYYFYSELSIELDGYPLLNPGARYTKEQVRRIIDYARWRHIDVVPCLEYYGHLRDAFRIERYAELAALPHGGEFNPRHARVRELLKDWHCFRARGSTWAWTNRSSWRLREARRRAALIPPRFTWKCSATSPHWCAQTGNGRCSGPPLPLGRNSSFGIRNWCRSYRETRSRWPGTTRRGRTTAGLSAPSTTPGCRT